MSICANTTSVTLLPNEAEQVFSEFSDGLWTVSGDDNIGLSGFCLYPS